MYIRALTTQ